MPARRVEHDLHRIDAELDHRPHPNDADAS
jgi:hypothetical protein